MHNTLADLTAKDQLLAQQINELNTLCLDKGWGEDGQLFWMFQPVDMNEQGETIGYFYAWPQSADIRSSNESIVWQDTEALTMTGNLRLAISRLRSELAEVASWG